MRTILHLLAFIVGGLFVISGCSSSPVENTASPTTVPRQDTASDVEAHQATSSESGNFLFYDSFATW